MANLSRPGAWTAPWRPPPPCCSEEALPERGLVVGLVGTQTKYKLILFQVGSQYGPGLEGGLRHWQQAAVGLCRTATNSQWTRKPSLCAGPGFKSPRIRWSPSPTRSGSCQTVPPVRRGRSVELGVRDMGAEAHISAVKCPGHCTTVQAGPSSSAGEPRAGQSVVTKEKPVNYCKFEFGAFILPVGDRK